MSPLLPIPLPAPSTSHRVDYSRCGHAPPRRPGSTMTHRVNHSFVDTVDTRVQYVVVIFDFRLELVPLSLLVSEDVILRTVRSSTKHNLVSPSYVRYQSEYRHEWQRQDADDRAIEHIIRTQALEAGARVDTLEDTGSSA
ncbi:hypothetical protein Tco_0924053 [Tanacetum coccineum]|uniref:Uncharacterized protein n=1 Tax=Tanacetum coccineum TaxID=301880 RepID=A0ABQ5D3Q9_9ASTR